ncbi:MAG TPA: hypothetical protein VGO75_05665 [Gemmatimonadaceae bacterium]|nr:hypothetical protein [Gemmatimonadaceae bacterium]
MARLSSSSQLRGESSATAFSLIKRYVIPSEYPPSETWRLIEWCRKQGADEFTIDCLNSDAAAGERLWRQFHALVSPYARGESVRERMNGKTVDDLTRPTPIWEFNPFTVGAVRQALPGGLFQYDPWEPAWFEDPILYRNGEMMLGVWSHEAFAVLRVSESEAADLEDAGFPSHESLPRAS